MTNSSHLISTADLFDSLGRPALRIIDCQYDLADPLAGHRAYASAHIPGAMFADLNEDLAGAIAPDTGRHPLPTPPELVKTLRRLGINQSSDVVVYDAGPGAYAARAWWLLRWLGHEQVRLLDGGLQRWGKENRPLARGGETIAPGDFSGRPIPDKVLTTAELVDKLDAIADLHLIDARDAKRFRGEAEPVDAVAGHVPGAVNVPFSLSLSDDGSWKSRPALESLWQNVLGADKSVGWSVMCGSGVTACHLAISALEAGYREPRLYVGSWSEWIRNPARPVSTGEDPETA